MYKYTIARQLATKRVITNRGEEVGKLIDLLIDERSGDIEHLLIEVDRGSKFVKKIGKEDRIIEIPYSAVTAVSDVFIVDEREVTGQGEHAPVHPHAHPLAQQTRRRI
ncbi:MAG: PRC-barrel domain-containing protein [Candidatus Diapherotrites archaeon]|nr:PRC-barrel domain-containing protein [Candidatus Diapherotrites archaeon]